MDDSSSQRVGEWRGVMSVGRDSVVGQVFNLIQWERYVFTTMIMSWALLDRGVDVTFDDSCDNAKIHYMEWCMAGCWNRKDFFAPDSYLYSKCKYFVVFLKYGYIMHISMLRWCKNKVLRTINVVKTQIGLQICISMSKYLSFVYYQGHFKVILFFNINACTGFQKLSASSNISACTFMRGDTVKSSS